MHIVVATKNSNNIGHRILQNVYIKETFTILDF